MITNLKTWPNYFSDVWLGLKRFEARKNDREYCIDEIVLLWEYSQDSGEYTGRVITAKITYVLADFIPGYTVFGFKVIAKEVNKIYLPVP